jgi:hypothetical protein
MIWLALKARSSSQVSQLALAIEAPVVTSFRAGLDDIPRLGMVLAMPPLTEAVLAPHPTAAHQARQADCVKQPTLTRRDECV